VLTLKSANYVVTNTNNSGSGTLRQAILDANANSGADNIIFNISGTGLKTILLTAALPAITDEIHIDGYTQSGSLRNSENFIFNGVLNLAIDGGGQSFIGLTLASGSSNSQIEGLNIHNFNNASIEIQVGSNGNSILGNLIGVNNAGSLSSGSNNQIRIYSNSNFIGNTSSAGRNIISGCSGSSALLYSGTSATGNNIIGNFIGMASDGSTTIGGINVGIEFNSGANSNRVGEVANSRNHNIITGTVQEAIRIVGATTIGIEILANRMFNLGTIPIDLNGDGLTLNDTGDGDTGPNSLINYPTIFQGVTDNSSAIYAELYYEGLPNTTYQINWYRVGSANGSDHGDAVEWLGRNWIDTDGTGIAQGMLSFGRELAVPAGTKITASITNNFNKSTSELAENYTLTFGKLEVTNNNDVVNGNTSSVLELISSPGADGISLREAILASNNQITNWGSNHIVFDLPSSAPVTISLTAPLPPLTEHTFIDGWSEPDHSSFPQVILDGSGAGSGADGIYVNRAFCTISAISIVNFDGNGIEIVRNDNSVFDCYVGVYPDGTTSGGNNRHGILIDNAPDCTIGRRWEETMVISGNGQNGILISGASSTGIELNDIHIGTDISGLLQIANGANGIRIENGASNNIIGEGRADSRLLISGNTFNGISLAGNMISGNTIMGNYIGLGIDGTTLIPNGFDGIDVEHAVNTTIGGIGDEEHNVISGNGANGVEIWSPSCSNCNNQFIGNIIGLDATGTLDLGNGATGIVLLDSHGNTIGGNTSNHRNIISGNGNSGISLSANNSDFNTIQGNYIGTDITGTLDLGNDQDGINFFSGPQNNQIGGSEPSERNIISGNEGDGIEFSSTSTAIATDGNTVQGNYIGVNVNGDPLPNFFHGIYVFSNVVGNVIGGIGTEGNVISSNGFNGIVVNTSCSGVTIQGNNIGSDPTGLLDRGNGVSGIRLFGPNNIVGGPSIGQGNSIKNNADDGIAIFNTSINNSLLGNTFSNNGDLAIDIGNNGVTSNDLNDIDTGPNALQNFPEISSIVINGSNTEVNATLNSEPNTDYRIEFFLVSSTDVSGHGEGETYLGFVNTNTNSSGNTSFSKTFNSLFTGEYICLTATKINGINFENTSEFSLAVMVSSVEICNNGLDDDGDGLLDCIDPDCSGSNFCSDADNDGVSDFFDLDDDNDGILDTVECTTLGPELIVNGDFENGYANWTSSFNRGANNVANPPASNGSCTLQGFIAVSPCASLNGLCNTYFDYNGGTHDGDIIITDPLGTGANVISTSNCIDNSGPCLAQILPDHTTGTGLSLYIDPNDIIGEVYVKQTINVTSNTLYLFSAWVMVIEEDPNIEIKIDGISLTGGINLDEQISGSGMDIWQEVSTFWDSGSVSGDVTIEITNLTTGCIGNDIRLDDISFRKVNADDHDGDGFSNCADRDSDGDGCFDVVEAGFTDYNNDGILGTVPVSVNNNGEVISGTDGYSAANSAFLNSSLESCFEICDNSIDDNGDGRVDEAYPANVQDNLILWLKADAGFSPLLWEDQSPYGNDATVIGDPNIVSSGQNFNPTIEFDGDDAVFSNLPQLVFNTPDQHVTIFCVYNPANASDTMGVYGNQINGALNNIVIYDGGVGNGNFTNTPIPELYGEYPHLTSVVLDEEDNVSGSLSSSHVSVNGEQVHTFSFDENSSFLVNSDFYVGSSGTNVNSQFFIGQISELIIYHNNVGNVSVSDTDRQKIQSYLALKYGISLPHDYVGSQ